MDHRSPAPAAIPAPAPTRKAPAMTSPAPAPRPIRFVAVPVGNPDRGHGATPAAAIAACRARGWDGAIDLQTADGIPVARYAAGTEIPAEDAI